MSTLTYGANTDAVKNLYTQAMQQQTETEMLAVKVPANYTIPTGLFETNGVFASLNNKTIDQTSNDFKKVIFYLRIKYCADQFNNQVIDIPEKIKYMQILLSNLEALLPLLSQNGGKKKTQKGGMDTAKIYNAQGLVQEMAQFNRSDTISPAMNFPSPFSAGTAGSTSISDLPGNALNALLPPLAGGKKKK